MQDRLTIWEDNYKGGKWSYHMDASVNDLCAKLAAYEDTGLTPDEIAALRAENAAFKADIEAGRLVRMSPIHTTENCAYSRPEFIGENDPQAHDYPHCDYYFEWCAHRQCPCSRWAERATPGKETDNGKA